VKVFTNVAQAALVCQVDAGATLELLMVRFDNPSGRGSDRSACDVGFGSDLPDCDHAFRFGLDLGDRCLSMLI